MATAHASRERARPMTTSPRTRLSQRLALLAFMGGGCVPISAPFIEDANVTHEDEAGSDADARDASPWDAAITDAAAPTDAKDAFVADAESADAAITDAAMEDAPATDAAREDAAVPRVCGTRAFWCDGVPPSSQQPLIPETGCCCEWGLTPSADDSCQ